VYFEEVDFSLRASQRGQRSVFVAESRAFHLGGGSSGQVKALRLFYSLRSRLQYAEKHLGTVETLALKLVTWTVEPIARSLHLLLRGRAREAWAVAQGYIHLLQWQWRRMRGATQPQG
jgi:GT2 family glycosyltransferase